MIGIIAIASSFVYPQIGKWKIKRAIEQDFNTVVSTISYLKTKTRAVNGTSVFKCGTRGFGDETMQIYYNISSQRNDGDGFIMHPDNLKNRIEVNARRDWSDDDSEGKTVPLYNLLSAKVNVECNQHATVFNAGGNSGGRDTGDALEVIINYKVSGVVDYVNYNAYKVRVNSATAYVQKYKWNIVTGTWRELN